MSEGDELDGLSGNVPPWVLRVVRDLAETKAGVTTLSADMLEVRAKLDIFVTRSEYTERHTEIRRELTDLREQSVKPLWDQYNVTKGEVLAQQRSATRARWVIGTILTVLGLIELVNSSGIHVTLH